VNTDVFLFASVLYVRAATNGFQSIESVLDISFLVSTFVEGTGWQIRCNQFGRERKTMSSLPGKRAVA
jgi:hypothetical protein